MTTNPLLLWGIAFEVAFAAAVIGVPVLRAAFGTSPPPLAALPLLAAFPFIVWGADEIRRSFIRRRDPARQLRESPAGQGLLALGGPVRSI